MLSISKYVTERDAFDHPTLRECFIATKLIGPQSDISSKKQYVNNLLKRYILEQVVFLPISLHQAQLFILRARDILESIIIADSTPMFEVPFTMSEVHDSIDLASIEFWSKNDERILDAVS